MIEERRDPGTEESRQKPFATVKEERGGRLNHRKRVVEIHDRRTLSMSKLVL